MSLTSGQVLEICREAAKAVKVEWHAAEQYAQQFAGIYAGSPRNPVFLAARFVDVLYRYELARPLRVTTKART